MEYWIGYVGTQQSNRLNGIGQLSLHRTHGDLTVCPFLDVPDAKYLAWQGGVIVSIVRRTAGAGIYTARIEDGQVTNQAEALDQPSPGCYVALRGNWAYTADFHAGTVCRYNISGVKPVLQAFQKIGEGAGCHQILFHRDNILVPCMERDTIEVLDIQSLAPRGRLSMPAGSGPRHGLFDQAHHRLYVVGQKDNTLYCFDVAEGAFAPTWQVPLLDKAVSPCDEAAAIRFSPDERFLYISIRGADQIVVLQCTSESPQVIQRVSSGGEHPRDMVLSPDGAWVVVANRYAGGLVCFRRNPDTGYIGEICGHADVDEAVSIVWNTQ